jgi:RNA polymerase sigma-70 factor (ECF subfamily)
MAAEPPAGAEPEPAKAGKLAAPAAQAKRAPPAEPSDKDLAARAVAGDDKAFAALLKRHGPTVRDRIKHGIGQHWRSVLDEDDVMQVTYLEAALKLHTFSDRGEGSFTAWLQRIADNNLRDSIRGLERAKRPDPRRRLADKPAGESYAALVEIMGFTLTTPSVQAAKGEMVTELDKALAKLPPDYEKVLRLYDLGGKDIEEVASQLGKSQGAVYMIRARAQERLGEVIGNESRFFSRVR